MFDFVAWIRKLARKCGSSTVRKAKRLRLCPETLEDRTNPSNIYWTGGAAGAWENPANWDTNAVPNSADDVQIMQMANVVCEESGAVAHSIIATGDLTINGSLTVGNLTMMGFTLTIAGELNLGGEAGGADLDISGQVHLGSGSHLYTSYGTNLLHGATIDGPGQFVISQGTTNVEGASSAANVEFTGGDLKGPDALTITDTMNWTGGAFAASGGTLNIASDAELNITGWGSKSITSWTFDADGEINWNGGWVNNTDSIVNVGATGAFNITDAGTWHDAAADGLSEINNGGTMTVTAAGMMGNTVMVEAEFNTTGEVDVQAGSLVLTNGGTFTGATAIAGDATLTLSVGEFTGNDGASFNGAGTLQIGDGTQTINSNYSPNGTVTVNANINLVANGNIEGAGTLICNGQFNWSAGRMSGTGATVLNGTTSLSFAAPTLSVTTRTLTNTGTMNLVGNQNSPTLRFILGASMVNNGLITLATVPNSTSVLGIFSQTGAMFTNNNVITVSGGGLASIESLPAPFTLPNGDIVTSTTTNKGSIRVQSGFLALSGLFNNNGYLAADGGATLNFGSGTFTFAPPGNANSAFMMRGDGSFNANAGAAIVAAPGATVYASNFYLIAGNLQGMGNFQASRFYWSGGIMSGPGTTTVGSAGVMYISGDVILNRRTLNDNGLIEWSYTELAQTIAMQNSATIAIDGGRFETYNVSGTISSDRLSMFNSVNTIVLTNNGVFNRNNTEVPGTINIEAAFENNGGQTNFAATSTFYLYSQSGALATSIFGAATYTFSWLSLHGGTLTLNGGYFDLSQAISPAYINNTTLQLSGTFNGAIQLRGTSSMNLIGALDVVGGTAGQEYVGLFPGSLINLHGFTLNVVSGRLVYDGTVNLQGGVITTEAGGYLSGGSGQTIGPGTVNGQQFN